MKDIFVKAVFAQALILAVLTATPAHSQTQGPETLPQIEWAGDIPIMPGLMIEPGLGFAFDSPEGRIVTIYLSGEVSLDQIEAYYLTALEPLGWQNLAARHWQRDSEYLAFEPITVGGLKLWKITIRP